MNGLAGPQHAPGLALPRKAEAPSGSGLQVEHPPAAGPSPGRGPGALRSGQVRFITRPKSRTMRATRQLMLPPSTVS
jgi:hypothetical protein